MWHQRSQLGKTSQIIIRDDKVWAYVLQTITFLVQCLTIRNKTDTTGWKSFIKKPTSQPTSGIHLSSGHWSFKRNQDTKKRTCGGHTDAKEAFFFLDNGWRYTKVGLLVRKNMIFQRSTHLFKEVWKKGRTQEKRSGVKTPKNDRKTPIRYRRQEALHHSASPKQSPLGGERCNKLKERHINYEQNSLTREPKPHGLPSK